MKEAYRQADSRVRQRLEQHFNAPAQPKTTGMAKKVAIEAAIPGWQPIGWYEERGVTNLPPISFEDQANAIVECVKAGASVIHTHPRDPDTGMTAFMEPVGSPKSRHAQCLMEIMDRAHDKVDFVCAHHTWWGNPNKGSQADFITQTKCLLEAGKAKGIGNWYVQSALIMTEGNFEVGHATFDVESIQEGVKWMEANGIKPMVEIESYAIPRVKQHLIETGLLREPFWAVIQEGKHSDDRAFAGDPWTQLEVITSLGLAKQALGENTFLGIAPAGRNWLTMATMALLGGIELIRVGIEDQFYLYPHRDDISQRASDTTEILVKLARALGREIATPQDVRDRVGIELTK
jgi:3-keto-5-aminohexanoate cleavage enzyme